MDSQSTSKQFARLEIKSTPLGHVLSKFREHYTSLDAPDTLVVPYILTCAAYLEAKLNDSLFGYSLKNHGQDVADALVTLSLPKKLSVLVPLLTDGSYSINKQHFVYQRLVSLIRVRNTLAHAKSELETVTAEEHELVTVPLLFSAPEKIPQKFAETNGIGLDLTLGASATFTPLEYHEALEKLNKWFFNRCPDRLSKVAMVVAHPKGHWKENHVTFVKYLG
jgi:hypothetical protein